MTKRIGFLTSRSDGLTSDDAPVVDLLRRRGWDVDVVVWDEIRIEDFNHYAALVFRSCWDYHLKSAAFLRLLEQLESFEGAVINSLPLIKWNVNKTYLLEVAARGLRVPASLIYKNNGLETGRVVDLAASEIVLKPVVSLNGYRTIRLTNEPASMAEALKQFDPGQDILVQEFMPEIQSEGELSFIFFNGIFSHSIRKTPAAGEFRIQEVFGGVNSAYQPTTAEIFDAKGYLEFLRETPVYARVDVVRRQMQFYLMEIEMIDPHLFLSLSKSGPELFSSAIIDRII